MPIEVGSMRFRQGSRNRLTVERIDDDSSRLTGNPSMKKPLCNRCPVAPPPTTLSAKILLTCMFVWLAMASLAIAQDVQSATVVGTVTDPTGAVVPNATVTLMNTATNVAAHATTNAEGAYYIPFQPAGTYTLTIDGTGFKKYVQIGIVLEIGQTPRFDVRMDVGTTSQSVEVTAATPLLATDNAVVGETGART